jgi:hypothetical protein
LRARAILVAGWIAFLLYAYPGFMPPGAPDQLFDTRTGSFTDWNPVVMTELWRIVGRVVAGPSGLLFVQSALVLFGAFAILRRYFVPRAAAIAAVCVLLFPPILATTAVIAPGALVAALLLAGTAAFTSARRAIRILGLVAMVFACGTSGAACIAAVPLVLAGFRWTTADRGMRRFAIALAAWLLTVGAGLALDRELVDARTKRPEVEAAVDDIVGMLRWKPELAHTAMPGVPLATTDPTELAHRAAADYGKHAKYTVGPTRVFEPPTETDRDAILAARYDLARTAPAAYLNHRWRVWRDVLGFAKPWYPVWQQFEPKNIDRETFGQAASSSLLQRGLLKPIKWLGKGILFRPHFYLFLAVFLAIAAVVRGHRDLAVWFASAIGYELALAVTINSRMFFESLWLVVATTIATLAFAVRELEARNERVRQQAAVGVAHDDRV